MGGGGQNGVLSMMEVLFHVLSFENISLAGRTCALLFTKFANWAALHTMGMLARSKFNAVKVCFSNLTRGKRETVKVINIF